MIHVEYEHPYRAIIDAAKKNGCDLVAMASHGRQGLSAVVLGSVTVKVLTHSNIPRFGVSITSCWWVIAPFQLLTKLLSKLDRLGCFSFLRVSENCWPTSSAGPTRSTSRRAAPHERQADWRVPRVPLIAAKSEGEVIPLIHRQFRVSYFIQIQKSSGLKVIGCRALYPASPQSPEALVPVCMRSRVRV
jgi:hypothetical protein